MYSEEQKDNPVAVLLVATFFILVATWFFAQISFHDSFNHFVAIFLSLCGMLFIILGWGILNQKSWAYTLSLIVSVFGLILGYTTGFLIFLTNPLMLVVILLFIPTIIILLKYKTLFVKVSQTSGSYVNHSRRYCPNCGRAIPFDANICPYCGKKFENLL